MKTAISHMQVDPNLLERIRQKEKSLKEGRATRCGQSYQSGEQLFVAEKGRATRCGQSFQREEDKFMPVDAMKELQIRFDEPELDDGFIELEWPELSREKTNRKHAEFRANDDHIIEKRIDRKAFDTRLHQDIRDMSP